MPRSARAFLVAALVVAAAGWRPVPADAGDAPAPAAPAVAQASDAAAEAAVRRFTEESASASPARRLDAVTNLAKVVHPSVAAALFGKALDETAETRVRTAAFAGLGRQTPSAKAMGPKLSKFLVASAEENRKRKARGDYGVRVDPKTGKSDYTSAEGKAALAAKRERGEMLSEAVRAFDALGQRDRDSVETLAEFLADGCDDLVAVVLGVFGKWKEWSVLPDLHDLYEMYPTEDKVNVGSVHDEHGDNQSAKRKWMATYGDPDRRRPRPVLVRALLGALLSITGERFTEPGQLRDFLKRPDVRRKVRSR